MSEESTAPKPAYLTITEDGMRGALTEARGDLFVASQMLGITATRLDRAIRVSATLQSVVAGIQDVKGTEHYLEATTRDFQQAIERRLAIGRIVGLDALHELASMPIDENSAQNQVKLAAAARLAGPPEGRQDTSELAETLRQLNADYQENAPRLRVVRERLTVEVTAGARGAADDGPVIQGESQRTP